MKDNKLIAEFMGIVYPMLQDAIVINCEVFQVEELKYHESWDWLMPVVVKCFAIHDDEEFMYEKWTEKADNLNYRLNNALLEINIQSLYEAVVEFIKEYNNG
jgi:hypothetical protein